MFKILFINLMITNTTTMLNFEIVSQIFNKRKITLYVICSKLWTIKYILILI